MLDSSVRVDCIDVLSCASWCAPGSKGSAVWNGHALLVEGMVMPNPYPPEFRARVLALVRAGKKVQQVAQELNLSDATIYNWRRRDEINTGARPGLAPPQAAELVAACSAFASLKRRS